ncbi:LacI family DNA-binding transcriptional regulator [Phycisphaerales bacterium AB-hyl4]|uniref:LacI family DNA-binding transcriptional regulator n=1 Tax=Natronomicrosphaera hydrolytica TaxID=3242702 RepID=A0ABV4U0B3_9BACT
MSSKLEQISQLTGKSPTTVARALRNDPQYKVRDSVRQQVLDAARQLGYVPNHLARSFASGKSFCIGVLLGRPETDLGTPFFAPVLTEMLRVSMKRGYQSTLLPIEWDERGEDPVLKVLQSRRIDGFFISSGMLGDRTLKEIRDRNVPVVTTETEGIQKRAGRVCVVRRDDRPGYTALAAELYNRGHQRIAYVGPALQEDSLVMRRRFLALKASLAEVSIELPEERALFYRPRMAGAMSETSEARWAAEQELDRLTECTAIVAATDQVAFGVADALRRAGVEPGRDIALAGFGNLEENPNFPTDAPFLTTIDPERQLRGRRIAEMLIEMLEDPGVGDRVSHVPTRLIVRDSMVDAAS